MRCFAQLHAETCEMMTEMPQESQKNIKNLDWVLETQKENIPNKITEKLWILPVGSNQIDRNAANIFLDPGSAFGTGTHPTTKLCLKWLSDNIQGGELVLDFGCGVGSITEQIAKQKPSKIIGADISNISIEKAKKRASETNLDIDYRIENCKKYRYK